MAPDDLRVLLGGTDFIHLDRADRDYWAVGCDKLRRVLQRVNGADGSASGGGGGGGGGGACSGSGGDSERELVRLCIEGDLSAFDEVNEFKLRQRLANELSAEISPDCIRIQKIKVSDKIAAKIGTRRCRLRVEVSEDEGVWSICCVPMPPLYSVVSLDFYDGGVDEEWLVLLLSTGTGDTEIVLLDDCHVDVPYEQIQISLSARLPPTTTLVQLAEEAGVLRDPTLYEKMKQSSERINNACPTSMDVCAGRGKITICTDKRTLSLFTPEEDEDEDDDL